MPNSLVYLKHTCQRLILPEIDDLPETTITGEFPASYRGAGPLLCLIEGCERGPHHPTRRTLVVAELYVRGRKSTPYVLCVRERHRRLALLL